MSGSTSWKRNDERVASGCGNNRNGSVALSLSSVCHLSAPPNNYSYLGSNPRQLLLQLLLPPPHLFTSSNPSCLSTSNSSPLDSRLAFITRSRESRRNPLLPPPSPSIHQNAVRRPDLIADHVFLLIARFLSLFFSTSCLLTGNHFLFITSTALSILDTTLTPTSTSPISPRSSSFKKTVTNPSPTKLQPTFL